MTEKPRANHDEWFRSSYSEASESYVEVRFESGGALMRDSKDSHPDSPFFEVSGPVWKAFLDHLAHERRHEHKDEREHE